MSSHELRRDLGKWGAIAMVVGTVIGSGIFAVPKAMTLEVGSPGRCLRGLDFRRYFDAFRGAYVR